MATSADGPGFWAIVASLFGGGGLSAIGAIWWSGRRQGNSEEAMNAMRSEFHEHVVNDKEMFARLQAQIDGNAEDSRKRHEDNLLRFGALSTQLAALPTDERMDRRFAELGALIRSRQG